MISVPLNKSTKTITTKKKNNMEFLNNAEEVSVQIKNFFLFDFFIYSNH